MSYNLKTLIVFDTNSLRSTEADEVAYSFFAFGKPFQLVEQFIIDNKLAEIIHLAVPHWAIEELKDQKQKQYEIDVTKFKQIAIRLSGLPHVGEMSFPEDEFDCATYVDEKASEFLKDKQIQLLELKEDIANNVLQSMMVRVMKNQGHKAPFAHSGKYKDAGFKDNFVWESLMHYEGVSDYDKVIFVCKDGDFNRHCEDEFKGKWKRHIEIEKNEQNVIAELKRDYENFIRNRKVYDFADKEYFKDYLNDILKNLSKIEIEGEELDIENYQVESYCVEVERTADEEGDFESPIIVSIVKIHVNREGKKEQIPVKARTTLADFETLTIEETEFDKDVR